MHESETDDRILALAENEKRILITDDKDFGELVFKRKQKSFGIILFRAQTSNPFIKFELLMALLKRKIPMKNQFVVLSENSIRIRKIL